MKSVDLLLLLFVLHRERVSIPRDKLSKIITDNNVTNVRDIILDLQKEPHNRAKK
jgi:hypothetical protein